MLFYIFFFYQEDQRRQQRKDARREKKIKPSEDFDIDPELAATMGFGGFGSSKK